MSAHHDHLEARYAFRTRMLDYLWAGPPVVATRGDALGDSSTASGLGRTVPPGDAAAFAGGLRAAARTRTAPPRATRIAARRAEAALERGRRAARRLVRDGAARAERRAVQRAVVRRAALAQYRWALAETLAGEGPARGRAVGCGRRLRRARDGCRSSAARAAPSSRGGWSRSRRWPLSLLVLAALLTKGRALTGADGLLASDQLQYFTWIREAGEHGLIGNEYDFAPDHRVFLHPGFLLSGLASQLARA